MKETRLKYGIRDSTSGCTIETIGTKNELISSQKIRPVKKNVISYAFKKLTFKNGSENITDPNIEFEDVTENLILDLTGPMDLLDDERLYVTDSNSTERSEPDPINELYELDMSHQIKRTDTPKIRNTSAEKVIHLFNSTKKDKNEEQIDLSLGLRLSLPDKIDVMTGVKSIHDNSTPVTSKKLMILDQEKSSVKKTLTIGTKLPFKKRTPSKIHQCFTPTSESEKLRSLFLNGDESLTNTIQIRTSEMEPSFYQISIPTSLEILIHARISMLLESYDRLLEARAKSGKRWFSFGNLIGLSRADLESMYLDAIGKKPLIPSIIGEVVSNPPPLPRCKNPFSIQTTLNPFDNVEYLSADPSLKSTDDSSLGVTEFRNQYPRMRRKEPQAAKPHPSTIKMLLECCDDLIVEGYFNETIDVDENSDWTNEKTASSVQIVIFSSQQQRQIIITYRGSIEQHAKPIRSRKSYDVDRNGLNTHFSDLYFKSETETGVFNLIEKLSCENPFCDIVFTGHSFGAALSMIASVRYAEKYPMMNVGLHVFGIPKISKKIFRLRAHSLPNLRIIRIENGYDIYVHSPLVGDWEHVGHTIHIVNQARKQKISDLDDEFCTSATAYKFGKRDQIHHLSVQRFLTKTQGKLDHEMQSYVQSIQKFTHVESSWVKSFKDYGGSGIVTAENEVRVVV